jgi:exodeoxyribonuclease VII small subunit
MTKRIPSEKINLQKAFQDLEQLTEELQGQDTDLEKSLAAFERGLQLAEQVKSRLMEIENRLETIRLKYKDTLKDVGQEE